MNVQKFEDLLSDFQRIPKTEVVPPTFMEIAGYPHYENVCSNILAFFFDTQEVHGFRDLFVRSLYECMREDIPAKDDLQTLKVSREVLTKSRKRIDILIETTSYIFVIENKMREELQNDLAEYKSYAQEVVDEDKSERDIIPLVLSPKGVKFSSLHSGFVNLTFEKFFRKIKDKLGNYLNRETSVYLSQLTDFMETILNHTKNTRMNHEMLDLLKREEETIDKLFEEKNKIYRAIIAKVKQIQPLVGTSETNQWIREGLCLVHEVRIDTENIISLETWFLPAGIETTIFIRDKELDKIDLLKNLEVYSEDLKIRDDGRLMYRDKPDMSILTPNDDVAAMLTDLLPQIKLKNV